LKIKTVYNVAITNARAPEKTSNIALPANAWSADPFLVVGLVVMLPGVVTLAWQKYLPLITLLEPCSALKAEQSRLLAED